MKGNRRIDWKQGMEIMPSTFIAADNYQKFHHDIYRKLLTRQSYGLLPLVKFDINCTIIDKQLKIQEIHCDAITKNGIMMNLELNPEPGKEFNLLLPPLPTGVYYIVEKIKGFSQYEENGIPYTEAEYEFELKEWGELSDGDIFPIIKIKKEDYHWEKVDYIPPCFTISSNRILISKHEEIRKLLNEIFNLFPEKKYQLKLDHIFSLLLLELNNFTKNEIPFELILLLKKIIKTILVSEPDLCNNTDRFLQDEYDPNDILKALNEALSILNKFKELLSRIIVTGDLSPEQPVPEEWVPKI